jgi:hypothetical protein
MNLVPVKTNESVNLPTGNLCLVRPRIECGRFDIEPGGEIFDRQEHAVLAGGVLRHPLTPL